MLNAAVQSKAGNHAVLVEVLVDVATQRPLQHDQWDQEASTHPPVLVGFLADSEVDSVAGAEEASVEGSVIEEDLAAAQGQVSVIRVAATDSAVKLRQMRLQVQEVAATIGEAMGGRPDRDPRRGTGSNSEPVRSRDFGGDRDRRDNRDRDRDRDRGDRYGDRDGDRRDRDRDRGDRYGGRDDYSRKRYHEDDGYDDPRAKRRY